MRLLLCFLFILFSCNVFATKQKWSEATLQALDKEQFLRLESGKGDPLFITQIIIQKSKNKPSIYLINAYTVEGILNKNKGYYVSALNNYLMALRVAEELKDTGRESASLNNIGIIYVLQENFTKAIDYFNRSLKLEEKRRDPLQKSIRLFNLGDCYKELKQYDEAIGFYTSSLLIEKRENNAIGELYAQLGLAEVYMQTNRLSDAENALLFAEKKIIPVDLESTVLFYKLKGLFHFKKKEYELAVSWLTKALNYAEKHQVKNELLDVYWHLSQLYEQQEAYQIALNYCQRHLALNNQLKSNYVKNQLDDLTYQYEIQRKELEIEVLKEQRELEMKNAEAMRNLRKFDWKIAIFSMLSLLGLTIAVVLGMRKLTKTS